MTGRGLPPDRVPTLTEVVDPPAGAAERPAPAALEPVASAGGPPVVRDRAHDEAIAQRVLADVQAHIDRVLESRIRSALEPALEALAARVIADTRRELASTLRDGLARALAQESSRHRAESGPR